MKQGSEKMDEIVVAGMRLESRWIGPPPEEVPTLVFLHEGLGCVALWKDVPERLAAATGCGALVYSRAGYGGSDPVPLPRPRHYLHDEALKVLPALLDEAGIRHAVLVGHSDGASIAIIHVGSVRDRRVEAAVLMAPHVFTEPMCLESVVKARLAYEKGHLRAALARYHGANVDCAFRGWNDTWLDPDFRSWNIEEYLAGIEVPLLLIQGHGDEYATTAQLEAIERQVSAPVTTIWLDECGHSPHRDRPDAVLPAMSSFIAEATS